MNQITSQVETITPAIAAEYLKHNTAHNAKRLSQITVNAYAEAMRRGEWQLNGQTIGFDWNGNLQNGQHRLHAVIKSGVSIQVLIVRNLPPEAFATIDCGRARTAGQLLGMDGVQNYNTVASIVRQQFNLRRGRSLGLPDKEFNPTNVQIIEEYNRDVQGYEEAASFAVKIRMRIGSAMAIQASYVGAAYYYLQNNLGYDIDFVARFFEQVFSFSSSDNPMLEAFRCRLLKDKDSISKLPSKCKSSLLAKVWNNYARGKVLKCVKWSEEEGTIGFI